MERTQGLVTRRGFVAGGAALAPLLLSRRAPAAEPPSIGRAAEPLSLGIVNTISDAPIFLAHAKGFFRDEGLDVTLQNFASGSTMITPLGAGQLDIGAGAVSVAFFNAHQRNVSVKIVADKARNAPGYGFQALLIRRDLMDGGKFRGFADLKGLRVAIPSRASVGEQSILNEALKAGGLGFNDCEKIYLPVHDQLAAMRNAAIDATVVSEPTVSLSIRNGAAKLFAKVDSFYPGQEAAVLCYGENLLNRRPELGDRFMRSYLRGLRYYNAALKDGHIAGENADEVIQVIAQYSVSKDVELIRAATPSGVDPNGSLNMAALAKDLAFVQEQGLVAKDLKLDTTIDLGFLERARRAA